MALGVRSREWWKTVLTLLLIPSLLMGSVATFVSLAPSVAVAQEEDGAGEEKEENSESFLVFFVKAL